MQNKINSATLLAVLTAAGLAAGQAVQAVDASKEITRSKSMKAMDRTPKQHLDTEKKESACGTGSCGTDEAGAKAAQEKHKKDKAKSSKQKKSESSKKQEKSESK